MVVACVICGKELKVKPYRIKRLKGGKITCSLECTYKLKEETMSGENNHQYGLTGHNNSSFKNEDTLTNYGYLLEYCPNHPRPHDQHVQGTRVKKHRLVVERNYKLFDSKFFEEVDGWIVLKEGYDVHHKDENKLNNDISNLEILSRAEHTSLHNNKHEIIRDSSNGRIIGVFKLGELLENPEEDNQQPS